ncbi:6402_t:CDS:2 [Entrophospora sp. SA101]|nr:6402_t:CDS:2 [Entrophospora sp. SA101]CAJ0837396.1 9716_t:CDS:2 [Entrophospora sp. SA101]
MFPSSLYGYNYDEINPYPNQLHPSNRYGGGRNYYIHPRNNNSSGYYNNSYNHRPYYNGFYNNNLRHINIAANKIYKFINQSQQNKNTKVILKKLLELKSIQQQLLNIQSKYDNKIGQLTFRINDKDDNKKKQILPITKENKTFLMMEDLILKTLEKLDKIYSDGSDLIRERRKEIVKIAQGMLDELDKEKDQQWKEHLL